VRLFLNKQNYIASFFALLLSINSAIASEPLALSLEFGIIGFTDERTLYVEHATTTIPFIPTNKNQERFQLYGLIVKEKNGKPFTGHLVHYYPGLSVSWLPFDNPKGERIRRRVSQFEPEYTASGFWAMIETLHDGDPLGVHKMEVFINGALYNTFEFEVVP